MFYKVKNGTERNMRRECEEAGIQNPYTSIPMASYGESLASLPPHIFHELGLLEYAT